MAVKPLIGFGLAIFLGGLLFRMYDGAITDFFSKYITNVNDANYLASNLVWTMIPIILLILGIVCLIFGSVLPGRVVKE